MLDVQASWLGMRPPEAVAIDSPAKDGDCLVVGATEFHVLRGTQVPIGSQHAFDYRAVTVSGWPSQAIHLTC